MSALVVLDASGFAPTLPTGDTWARTGVRALVHDAPPQGRRLTGLGALAPCGPDPWLVGTRPPGQLDAVVLLDFLWHAVAGLTTAVGAIPPGYRRSRPLVVVLDNSSVHRSTVVNEAATDLARIGVRLFFLPPYSSELNRIEPLWRQVKYQGHFITSEWAVSYAGHANPWTFGDSGEGKRTTKLILSCAISVRCRQCFRFHWPTNVTACLK